jgi:hypothetical protein
MTPQDAQARVVYDYEYEEPSPSGRRRRQVADWGVGEELFDRMPRSRRFARGVPEPRTRERRPAAEPPPARRPAPPAEAPRPRAVAAEPAPAPEVRERPRPEFAERPPEGRKTVVISGRPGDKAYRRPPRTVEERVAARPDRLAMWAVALGLLLIFIAVVTASL